MFLLDVNILIALAWDDHVSHPAAHNWFVKNVQTGFATCHVTQSGFVRVSLSIYSTRSGLTAPQAITMLDKLTSHTKHSFWEDGAVETRSNIWKTVRGHKQVTDANLFLIAKRNQGALATFDRDIRGRLPQTEQNWVEVIDS